MIWYSLAALVLIPVIAVPRYFLGPGSSKWFGLPGSAAVLTVLLAIAALIAAIALPGELPDFAPQGLIVVLSVVAAAVGGGPVTEAVFGLAARKAKRNKGARPEKVADKSLLRGGMWIGILERVAIASTLWATWPEGLAVVLAVKGLGRFAELKQHAAAEQFILGTFSSVLWACAAYGTGLLLVR